MCYPACESIIDHPLKLGLKIDSPAHNTLFLSEAKKVLVSYDSSKNKYLFSYL